MSEEGEQQWFEQGETQTSSFSLYIFWCLHEICTNYKGTKHQQTGQHATLVAGYGRSSLSIRACLLHGCGTTCLAGKLKKHPETSNSTRCLSASLVVLTLKSNIITKLYRYHCIFIRFSCDCEFYCNKFILTRNKIQFMLNIQIVGRNK